MKLRSRRPGERLSKTHFIIFSVCVTFRVLHTFMRPRLLFFHQTTRRENDLKECRCYGGMILHCNMLSGSWSMRSTSTFTMADQINTVNPFSGGLLPAHVKERSSILAGFNAQISELTWNQNSSNIHRSEKLTCDVLWIQNQTNLHMETSSHRHDILENWLMTYLVWMNLGPALGLDLRHDFQLPLTTKNKVRLNTDIMTWDKPWKIRHVVTRL